MGTAGQSFGRKSVDVTLVVGELRDSSAETAEAQVEILRTLKVRWDLLADAAKGPAVWAAIARQMGPQALRMNQNTLVRQGVLGKGADNETIAYVAGRLADAEEIRRSRQFPYQFLAAYLNAGSEVPQKIKAALHQAAEIACGNIPGWQVQWLSVSTYRARCARRSRDTVAVVRRPRCAVSMWRHCSLRPFCAVTRTAS